MPLRLAVVVLVAVVLVAGRAAYLAWQRRVAADAGPVPHLPADVLAGERTWVVFTTPYCATCGPVTERLRAGDPGAGVVTVDATRRPDLAEAFRIRSAPTALLADAQGAVLTRLVGPDAVAAAFSP